MEPAMTIAEKYVRAAPSARPRRHPLRKLLILGALLLCIQGSLLPRAAELPQDVPRPIPWNLTLVDGDTPVPEDFAGELVELRGGKQVDRRIYPDLQQMFDDMRAQQIYPLVASGYRTGEKQRQLLEERVQSYQAAGLSYGDAWEEAADWVALPGYSEHQTGLAVDINQEIGRSTAEEVYTWLAENAHRYGFILRYPQGKEDITGYSCEPWHYRYVGREAAGEMYAQGLTLEEYLEGWE